MTDDIVTRLRLTPVLLRRDSLGQSVIDYEACKKYVNEEGVKLMREAADEIERLRGELFPIRKELDRLRADRDELQKWKDAHNTFWRDRAERRDAMREGAKERRTMTDDDDIVARLRVLNHHAKKLAENESLHDLHRDALTRCENLTWQAADEIERLRAGGCARDQKTTQYCAEAVTLQREIERLREALRLEQEESAACAIDRKETQRERDEARRLYINEMCLRDYGDTSARIREAKARGWNCFDGDGWSDPGDECRREAL